MLALANVDRVYDAAILVLHRLTIAGNGNDPGGVHARIERNERCPAEEENEESARNGSAGSKLTGRIAGFAVDRRRKSYDFVHAASPSLCA